MHQNRERNFSPVDDEMSDERDEMSNVPERKKCVARDHGTRCQKKKTRRGFCKKHYDRWLRNNGETRLKSELKAIKAKVAWRQRDIDLALAMGEKVVDPIFGPITKNGKGEK